MSGPRPAEPFEPAFEPGVIEDLRARLRATRWPPEAGEGWEWGVDLPYLRELCAWWASEYEAGGMLERLGELPGMRSAGLHFQWGRAGAAGSGEGLAVLLIHGWPGAPLEFRALAPRLMAAGHDVVVPSLPGYGFSEAPERPLGASEVATLLAELMAGLGYDRFVVQGGDWGTFIGARMAFDEPGRVAGFHCNAPGFLPTPPDLGDSELSEAELGFAQAAREWRSGPGFHMLVHGASPDSLGVGLSDSPAGLAGWLLPRYRAWSDCGGDLESVFSRRDLCDFLTFYWATGTAATALRLYAAEARSRWRLGPGERIGAPVGVADFPGELVRPPREWTERICEDLRGWTEMPRGGHFAAFEQPDLLADDLLGFIRGL